MDLSKIQFGVDAATSLAILASAITFLINQRLKTRETKRRQLDESVRAVTVDEFQSALGNLSTAYVKEIVRHTVPLQASVSRGLERLEKSLELDPKRANVLMDAMANTTQAISDYINAICAYNYQIYPLLDSIEGGESQIQEFRRNLQRLMDSYNNIGRGHESLFKEVRALCDFCAAHPLEQADHEALQRMAMSIVADKDYRQWVDSFVPSGKEEAYWACVDKGDFEGEKDLLMRVVSNVIGGFYKAPARMQAQVIYLAYSAIIDARQQCKEFLVGMAAINYWLIRKGGGSESLPDVIQRYRSQAVFAVDSEIR
ncbi:Uncharacterised protein [Bordetella pertussis]|uniref:Uncharacterized protein n=3 Tax=Bordetella pertussis TaxID=520 RepID=A0A0E7UFK4_BORPT|nr:hypothetical protein [Bordetella pertussis]ETA64571.1 hypothetical protein V483_0607 [Bordetella pertussis CHLA-11]ETH00393.1 hypothetical protein L569_0605 [Bordetella pertussis 2250905]ETH05424.1 hypothetical protein L570_0573 [Bordetella pertussis 2356847]ETH07798.1 hypothetical protein L571_0581 [Bordetella pertussis 2371640]ETH13531.1 hypothetical protein L574_0438 [Bordetella pertussis STO1-SEAT-0006]ETH15270.1 hypothetical protein L575_0986 [Bordetella pertussis STO1-SEAT-0007]ETH2